jgi:hypothetical protein
MNGQRRPASIFPDHCFTRRTIDAVENVVRRVALQPRDLGKVVAQVRHAHSRGLLEVVEAQPGYTRHDPLNEKLGHQRLIISFEWTGKRERRLPPLPGRRMSAFHPKRHFLGRARAIVA